MLMHTFIDKIQLKGGCATLRLWYTHGDVYVYLSLEYFQHPQNKQTLYPITDVSISQAPGLGQIMLKLHI